MIGDFFIFIFKTKKKKKIHMLHREEEKKNVTFLVARLVSKNYFLYLALWLKS